MGGATVQSMESKLARIAEQTLLDVARKLSPAQRVAAFAEHSRCVQQLYRAGQQLRAVVDTTKVREPV